MKTYRITYKNPNISPIVVRASSLRVAINNATRQLEKQRANLYARGFAIEHLQDTEIQDAGVAPAFSIDFAGFDTLKALAAL